MILKQRILETLPPKPYCTDQLGYLNILPKISAIDKKYIQYNHANLSTLIYDIDRDDNLFDLIQDSQKPTPNLMAINKDNGHSHFFYCLKDPVYQANFDQKKASAFRFACRVDAGLTATLEADQGFGGLIAKNVFSNAWRVEEIHGTLWELSELADYCPKEKLDQRRRIEPIGIGRNCTVFDTVRKIAYRLIREPFLSFEFFHFEVVKNAHQINHNFPTPLTSKEVDGIAKSISNWVWTNMSPQGFIEWQKAMNKRSQAVRTASSLQKAQIIKDYKQMHPEASIRLIAELFGYSHMTVYRALL